MLQERLLLPLPNSCRSNSLLPFPKTPCLFDWRKCFWPLGLICCIRLRLGLNSHHVSPPWDSWSAAGRRGLLSKRYVGAQFISQLWERRGKGATSCLPAKLFTTAQDIEQSQCPVGLPNNLCAVVSCNDLVSKIIHIRYYPGNISFLNAPHPARIYADLPFDTCEGRDNCKCDSDAEL